MNRALHVYLFAIDDAAGCKRLLLREAIYLRF